MRINFRVLSPELSMHAIPSPRFNKYRMIGGEDYEDFRDDINNSVILWKFYSDGSAQVRVLGVLWCTWNSLRVNINEKYVVVSLTKCHEIILCGLFRNLSFYRHTFFMTFSLRSVYFDVQYDEKNQQLKLYAGVWTNCWWNEIF